LLGLLFELVDGSHVFLRNIWLPLNYTVLQPRRPYSPNLGSRDETEFKAKGNLPYTVLYKCVNKRKEWKTSKSVTMIDPVLMKEFPRQTKLQVKSFIS
jgi:hypothetical protein